MQLPNFEFAIIEDEKIRDYCLSPDHPLGKHKAKVFEKRLGFVQNDSDRLKALILEKIAISECMEAISSDFGRRFIVDFILVNFDKQAVVRTAWIIKNEELIPRLTSCYIVE